jgi:N-acetylglucosamine-6-sulfatase
MRIWGGGSAATGRTRGKHLVPLLVAGALVLGAASVLTPSVQSAYAPPAGAAVSGRPNIVVIMSDDQDLGLMRFMPKTKRRLASQGATLTNYYVNTSLCCVARASLLRGQYAHNTLVEDNVPPAGGFLRYHELKRDQDDLAVWLRDAGYTTALAGKYLNGFPSLNSGAYAGQGVDKLYVPPGWDQWFAPVAGRPYWNRNYTVNDNGRLRYYGKRRKDYLTDVLRRWSVDYVDQQADQQDPFFLYVVPYAPHAPFVPPARYKRIVQRKSLRVPRTPDFNENDVSDKPTTVSKRPRLTKRQKQKLDTYYRRRAASVRGVDDLVGGVLNALSASGQLDNTYVFFTSDNGFHLGQHRLPAGKYTPYQTDIHMPMLVRGPGITPGSKISQLTGNIDVAPTLMELADASAPPWVDGMSFAPWLRGTATPGRLRDYFLLERKISSFVGTRQGRENADTEEPRDPAFGNWARSGKLAFYGVRSWDGYTYVKYRDGQEELYNTNRDPYELANLISTGRMTSTDAVRLTSLRQATTRLVGCSGADCR